MNHKEKTMVTAVVDIGGLTTGSGSVGCWSAFFGENRENPQMWLN